MLSCHRLEPGCLRRAELWPLVLPVLRLISSLFWLQPAQRKPPQLGMKEKCLQVSLDTLVLSSLGLRSLLWGGVRRVTCHLSLTHQQASHLSSSACVSYSLTIWTKMTPGSSFISVGVIKHSNKKQLRALWIHLQNTSPKAQGMWWKRVGKIAKSQRNKEFV